MRTVPAIATGIGEPSRRRVANHGLSKRGKDERRSPAKRVGLSQRVKTLPTNDASWVPPSRATKADSPIWIVVAGIVMMNRRPRRALRPPYAGGPSARLMIT
jgi:hypothetical protein